MTEKPLSPQERPSTLERPADRLVPPTPAEGRDGIARRLRPLTTGTGRSETNRVESFSDAVFAIVLTLLVLELLPGSQVVTGEELLRDWPAYVAYLAAFFTTAALWLSHHQTFTRLASVDTRVLALNVAQLLGVTLVPLPTALIANALQDGTHEDQFAAIVVYAVVIVLIGISWTSLGLYLSRHTELLHSPDHRGELRATALAAAGCVVVAGLGVALGLLSPPAALALFLLVSSAFILSTVLTPNPDAT